MLRNHLRRAALLPAVAAFVAAACCCASGFAKVELVVPAYFYPAGAGAGYWGQLTTAASQVPVTAIMNPGNGPGASRDNNYSNVVNSLRAAGGRVIGYVYSSYGSRPAADVKADIDRYASLYNVDGIFVDEMSNTGPAQKLDYYKSIYDHVKGINPTWEVMGNPGTTTIEQYLTWPAADRLMVFENVGSSYPGYVPSAWNANWPRERFVHLVHSEPSATTMEADLALSVTRNAGGIYVTNDVLNNPWDTLPPYWAAEVARAAAINAALLDGDFTENGAVAAEDLARWKTNYGATGAPHGWGDADGDGDVDGSDLLTWQSQLGQASLAAAAEEPSAGQVPEPAAAALATLALAAGMAARRRQ